MRNWVLGVCGAVLVSALAGCEQQPALYQSETADSYSPAPMPSAESQGYAGKQLADVAGAPPAPGAEPGNPSSQSFLAYRYGYAFALPAKAVAPTAKSHAAQCQAAGPSKCQVLNASENTRSEDNVNASLSLRAEPKWLKAFTANMQSSVKDAKGEMTSSNVTAEDLTRQILDTDARLKAQKVLRTRLENLLATRDAKLPDLLALERELARVQGQIESATTTLNVLRKRVSMSVVDINYQTKQTAVTRSAFDPIVSSMKGFVRTFSYSLSYVIDFIAGVLPWLLLIIPGLWFIRRWWRGRKTKASPPKTPKKAMND